MNERNNNKINWTLQQQQQKNKKKNLLFFLLSSYSAITTTPSPILPSSFFLTLKSYKIKTNKPTKNTHTHTHTQCSLYSGSLSLCYCFKWEINNHQEYIKIISNQTLPQSQRTIKDQKKMWISSDFSSPSIVLSKSKLEQMTVDS